MDPAKRDRLREEWRRRQVEAERAEETRWLQSMDAARAMANRLREKWGASDVLLFGSVAGRVLGRGRMKSISDVDIAVNGINPAVYYSVYADVEKLSPFPVDLVLMEDCSEGLREVTERDGIRL